MTERAEEGSGPTNEEPTLDGAAAIERQRGLWQWLEDNAITLHCNYVGGNEAWSATFDDFESGETIGMLGPTPLAAVEALRAKLGDAL